MKTNEIEEAIIETAPEPTTPTQSDADLMARLNVATERKEPTAETQAQTWDFSDDAPSTETKPAETKTATDTTKAPDNNFREAEKPKTATSPTTPTAVQPDQGEPKISKEAKHASARIAVGMLDLTQKSIFIPLLNRKFKKKFTAPEMEKLDTLADELKADIEDKKDLALRNKFDRLLKRHTKKVDAVPLEEREEKDLTQMFYTYMDVTGGTLPPEYLLIMGVLQCVGKRSIDLFTD